jgi:hypothetical protein
MQDPRNHYWEIPISSYLKIISHWNFKEADIIRGTCSTLGTRANFGAMLLATPKAASSISFGIFSPGCHRNSPLQAHTMLF